MSEINTIETLQAREASLKVIENFIKEEAPFVQGYKVRTLTEDEHKSLLFQVGNIILKDLNAPRNLEPTLPEPERHEPVLKYFNRLIQKRAELDKQLHKNVKSVIKYSLSKWEGSTLVLQPVKIKKGFLNINVEMDIDSYFTKKYSYNSMERLNKFIDSLNYITGEIFINPVQTGKDSEIKSREYLTLENSKGEEVGTVQTFKNKVSFLINKELERSIQIFLTK